MKFKINSLFFFILFILFLLFIYMKYIKKEYFENTCQSVDGNFIVISDDNDIRCLKNQKNQNKKEEIDENQLDNISCITTQNDWGILENGKCISLHSKNQNQTNSFWDGFKFIDINQMNQQNQIDTAFDSISSISLSSLQEEEEEESRQIKAVRDCNKEKLPNSLPCFVSESFQNQTPDYDTQCKTTYGKDFGFYTLQQINGNTSVNCRKYYSPVSPNDYTQNGTYQPEKYGIYIPKNNQNNNAMTGCYLSDMDFNDICRKTQNSSLYGVFKLLKGKDGNCYHLNGLEDISQSNAICSQNYQTQIPKISVYQPPFSFSPDTYTTNETSSSSTYYPNLFTKCHPQNTDFNIECKKMLSDLTSVDIQGYDCPIGQYRSKCIYE